MFLLDPSRRHLLPSASFEVDRYDPKRDVTKIPPPQFTLPSGHLPHQTAVSVLTVPFGLGQLYNYEQLRVHYKLCMWDHEQCAPTTSYKSGGPSRAWRHVLPGSVITVSVDNADDLSLGVLDKDVFRPLKLSLTAFVSTGWDNRTASLNGTMSPFDSEPIVTEYYVEDGTYGMAYMVPYYNHAVAGGYSGKVPEVDLEVAKYNRLRIHNQRSDWADYYSKALTSTEIGPGGKVDTDIGIFGTAPYESATSINGKDQVHITDLATINAKFKGFQSGFAALSGGNSYGFLVPWYDGTEYVGTVIRIKGGTFTSTDTKYEWTEEFRDLPTSGSISTLDLTLKDPSLRGFLGGFAKGDYAYFVPYFDSKAYSGKLVRVHVETFTLQSVQVIDLQTVDSRLAGFYGGFATNFAGAGGTNQYGTSNEYAYLAPYKSVFGPVAGTNTKYSADGYHGGAVNADQVAYGGDHLEPQWNGMLVQIDLGNFAAAATAWAAATAAAATAATAAATAAAATAGTLAAATATAATTAATAATLAAAAATAAASCVKFIDLTSIDETYKGFSGGFIGGRYGYLVPYSNGFEEYHGNLVRFDLTDFTASKVQALDLTAVDPNLKGFVGGFAHGGYGYLVPYRNGEVSNNSKGRSQFSLVTRIDLNDFSATGVTFLDVSSVPRKNFNGYADQNLRGFNSGWAAGDFLYFAPHFNGVWHGKTVRVDARDFGDVADKYKKWKTALPPGSKKKFPDYDTGYWGTQELDLQMFDLSLAGFTGGFIRKRPPPTPAYYNTVFEFGTVTPLGFAEVGLITLLDGNNTPTLLPDGVEVGGGLQGGGVTTP